MFHFGLSHVPPMSQFSKPIFTPSPSATLASSPKTSANRGMLSSTGRSSSAPAKPQTHFAPKSPAERTTVAQSRAVSSFMSGLP